ncbi:MAG: histidinol dehydrogenase [Bacteroidetes bacterium]|nr:histidinol dehydrogenase [Bacteroidota bacterium]
MLKIYDNPNKMEWSNLAKRPTKSLAEIETKVKPILLDVKTNGDKAIIALNAKLDHFHSNDFIVSKAEIESAQSKISDSLQNAILQAKSNIEKFHLAQKEHFVPIETMEGVCCWRKSVAIEKVGLYIPGGTAPLFSTVLMLGIPAQIAGCKEIILCTPPNSNGDIHPAILFAAKICGINSIFKIGGAQAIAAMAYGTESVPKVFKIFGPGNQYVTAAKQLVLNDGISIDMPAGPSELLIIANETANAAFVASDLLSQAEHGEDSQVVLLCNSEMKTNEIIEALKGQLNDLPRKAVAEKAISNSKAIIFNDLANEGIQFSNFYAPEHLIIALDNPEPIADLVINAGSVFMGHLTPESAGDYASGTNHTLPTNGNATAFSGVSLDSFVKKITFQQISKIGLQAIGPIIEEMADAEMLSAHKNAVSIRLKTL